MEFIEPYNITVLVIGLTGFTLFLQLLLTDIIGIKVKHTPGYPISPEHNDLHFRSSRAFANTNESVAIFILLVSFAILSSANPDYLNLYSVLYLVGRVGHMLFYYANLKLLRSVSFGISLLGLIAIFIVGILAWL